MPYFIADEEFRTKHDVTERCREILKATPDGESVSPAHLPFLFSLFHHHDEWQIKSNGGVLQVTTQTTDHSTRCFALVRTDGTSIDISFPHSIKLIPTTRSKDLTPQQLIDYRNAARTAINSHVRSFRDENLASDSICPITNETITRDTCAVDHVAPITFDKLLFDFTCDHDINPLNVSVGSRNGTVAIFDDTDLESQWIEYHDAHANLRLLSRTGHAQLSSQRIDWAPALNGS